MDRINKPLMTPPKRYTKIEKLPPCWRRAKREWYIDGTPRDDDGRRLKRPRAKGPTGQHYQQQCYCTYFDCFINPNGATCRHCKRGTWPPPARHDDDEKAPA